MDFRAEGFRAKVCRVKVFRVGVLHLEVGNEAADLYDAAVGVGECFAAGDGGERLVEEL